MKIRMMVVVLSTISISAEARASLIQYNFGGVITSASPSTGVSVGDRFTGTFTYETNDAVPNGSGNGSQSYYFGQYGGFTNPPDASGFTIQVDGKTILDTQGGLGMGLTNVTQPNQPGFPAATQSLVGITGLGQNGSKTSADVQFYNPTASVLPSLGPPTSINLSDFPNSTLYVYGYGNSGSSSNLPVLQGNIDTLTAVPTPEPGTLTIFAIAGWFLRSRRRRA